jgi:hypothetical protein
VGLSGDLVAYRKSILLVGALGALSVGAQDNTANATRQVVKANLCFHSATHLAGTVVIIGPTKVIVDDKGSEEPMSSR